MKSSLAVAALENQVQTRRPAGTVVHSARGRTNSVCGGRQVLCLDHSRYAAAGPTFPDILWPAERWYRA